MCEAPQTGSNAKPEDTFTEVVEQIEELKSNYLEKFDSKKKACDNKQESTLKDVEAGLYTEFNKPNLDYRRLKTYLECKIMECDTDDKIRITDIKKNIIENIIPIFTGAAATKILIGTGPILSLAIAGVVCIVLGLKVEIPIKKQHNKKRFYEICLKVLEQYLPAKNEVNNSQNLKCSVKTSTKHKKNKK